MRIVLIGPRGCGKSMIGRTLARKIGCAFSDLDNLTAAVFEEPTVAAIWQAHGEAAWRAAEVHVLRKLLKSRSEMVIALGGGTPIISEARALLESERDIRICYLKCSARELARRLAQEPGDRPSITGRGAIEEVDEIVAAREPVYEALAHFTINAEQAPAQVVERLMCMLPNGSV